MPIANLVWIGISLQKDAEVAFEGRFLSGKILGKIQSELSEFRHYNDNLVNFAPLDENGKIRYPNAAEILAGRKRLLDMLEQINPVAIFTLGGLVTKNLSKTLEVQLDFPKEIDYQKIPAKWPIIPIHHPAYIGIYKRKELNQYLNAIKRAVAKSAVD